MIRFGMHSSLWTDTWTREAAEQLIPEAKQYGIDLIEVSLLTPETIDVEHTRALFKEHGVAPSGSLCLPMEATAPHHPKEAERFLIRRWRWDTPSAATFSAASHTRPSAGAQAARRPRKNTGISSPR